VTSLQFEIVLMLKFKAVYHEPAPACVKIRRHCEFSLVAAACKAVRPHESLAFRQSSSSPLRRSSKSSALSHRAAWC